MKLFKLKDTTFSQFDATVKRYLSKTFSTLGQSYNNSQVFMNVYEGIKGIMQNMKMYIEDAFTEQNIYTASRKRSFFSLARLSGYEPFYGSAASGTVILKTSITNGDTKKIFIKNHSTIIDNSTGLLYTLIFPNEDYVIDMTRALANHRVSIVQGIWKEATFTAYGNQLETFTVTAPELYDKQYVEVHVNGIKYNEVACLYDMNENENSFVVTCAFDGTFEVMFGNGVHGKQLNEGDTVVVSYISHDGSNGNIAYPGSEKFEFISQVYDSNAESVNTSDFLTLSLDAPLTGGTDADSIKEIKKMVGYNSRSLVIASAENLIQYLNRFSFVGRSSITTIPGSLKIEARCLSSKIDTIKTPEEYLATDPKEFLLTDKEKEMVIRALDNSGRMMTGVTLDMTDPEIQQYAAICYVKPKSEYAYQSIIENLEKTIGEYFRTLPDNITFISKSDLIKKCLDADDSIESLSIDFISKQAEDAYNNGYYYIYDKVYNNGVWSYKKVKKINDSFTTPGLDAYGNIEISSLAEVPLLHGNFHYYPNKGNLRTGKDSIVIPTLTFVAI